MKRHLCVLLAQIAALSVALGAPSAGEDPCMGEERAPDEGPGWSEAKRVAFNAWGGKRQGAIEWNKGRPGTPGEDAEKRVAFNAWGGKRGQFSAWGGKRGPQPDPRAFFPWGGKRDGSEEGAEEEDGQRGVLEWGQPEEASSSSREVGEAAWGRPLGRGRRSSSRGQPVVSILSDMAPWERKRLAALWRAAKLQPARQNRRAVGADFFPWGGKRAGPPA